MTRYLRRRNLLAGAAALAGVATAGFLPGTAAGATRTRPGAASPPDLGVSDWPVIARVSAERALQHLKHLSDWLRPRVGGTGEEHEAAEYMADVLRRLQYRVELQPFPAPDKYLADLRIPDGRMLQSGASPEGTFEMGVTGHVVDAGRGDSADFPPDVRGKLVLFDHVGVDSLAKVRSAVAGGARAVLMVARSSNPERKAGAFTPRFRESFPIPILGLAQYHGEVAREYLGQGGLWLWLSTFHFHNLTSYNVIAERPATRSRGDGRVVMVTAHYDAVPGSPGANDDGSGTVLCLELARVLRLLPTRRAVRFALWGSEEQGLLGSRHYVNQLDDAGARRIAGCFQNDMVATSHPPANTYWLLSLDGGRNATTDAVAAAARRLGYTQAHGPARRGASDHVPFHQRGIPAGNFSWRGEGGPHQLEPLYHTPEDTIAANISPQRLQVSLELIGCAAYNLARQH
ncbi:aminopeptidase [Longimycelium tulufanense]|uniref:Aminopeptidase n=1 Tax=Longimycelium tulufanense TaxID=907463 RepID=A0A8J3CH28_9PSEU|nr:M28 family metallopeptidase [Longimycelium tulufanense]GGM74363.1 aminopeptidase [Longimycelium tulufanense]